MLGTWTGTALWRLPAERGKSPRQSGTHGGSLITGLVYTDGCDIEVRNEQVVNSVQEGCKWPVSKLFQMIDADLSIRWLNGFGCDIEAVYASFNETWGYPEKIEYAQEAATPTNIGPVNYLVSRLGGGACALTYSLYTDYVVQSLTPLS